MMAKIGNEITLLFVLGHISTVQKKAVPTKKS